LTADRSGRLGSDQTAIDGSLALQSRLVRALREPACYPHRVARIAVIETHISFVLLTGAFAYKIKKSVDLGFVDFTSLEKRRHFCEEELRLNGSLAPTLYLGVVPVCGPVEAPRIEGNGEVLEYAVRMRQFPQEALADRMLASGAFAPRHVDALANRVAAFHEQAAAADESDAPASVQATRRFVFQNFAQMLALPAGLEHRATLERIENWTGSEHERLEAIFVQRARQGGVRECHGDLHLGNVVLLDDEPTPFDSIEFNPELRWIDVMNEVAFVVMDLHSAKRRDLAARFLNVYLESSGDYEGIGVLRYYLVYRAMVRAKIGLMRLAQLAAGSQEAAALARQSRRYLALARAFIRQHRPFMVITHGLSGSGKTTLSQPLLELSGAIRIRSDVERKRMHGLSPRQPAAADVAAGLYRRDVSEAVYQRLLQLAERIVDAGHCAIVDATFLRRDHRDKFADLAARKAVPFAILDFVVGEDVLRQRVAARARNGGDASDADMAVLDYQLRSNVPIQFDERGHTFCCDASMTTEQASRAETWTPLWRLLFGASGR
jgi:aminoglycoside phosphotransferase family enzyme/predicted kinase